MAVRPDLRVASDGLPADRWAGAITRAARLSSALFLVAIAACAPAAAPSPTTAPTAAPKPTTAPAPASPVVSASPVAAASPAAQPAASPAAQPAASPAAVAAAGPSASASPAAFAGPRTAITASYSELIADNLPLWVAADAGIFDQNGLDVTLQFIQSTQGVPALLSGQIQFADIGGSGVLAAAAQGGDLTMIGMLAPVYPFQMYVPADIKTVSDLKGKKVGVSSPGSSSDIATRVALTKVGLQPDVDVTVVAVGSLQNRVAALQSGAIQGGVSNPPDSLDLEAKGFHALFSLAQLKLPAANTGVASTHAYVTAHKDVTQRYVDSLMLAIARARQDKPVAIAAIMKYLKLTDDNAAQATYDFFMGQVIPAEPHVAADQFKDSVDQLGQKDPKVHDYDLSRLIDDSFVQDAVRRSIGK